MKQFQMVGNFFLLTEKTTTYIIAANYESALSHDSALKEALIKEGVQGSVQLDMLLKTGTSINRFGTIDFDGKRFIRSSSRISMLTKQIKEKTTLFFQTHTELFKHSTLTDEQISLVLGLKEYRGSEHENKLLI